MPPYSKNSIVAFFLVGGLLLIIPLILILFWNGSGCFSLYERQTYCPTPITIKTLISFLPFLMVIGGVLIGYNLKRISDSFAPPKEETDDDVEGADARDNQMNDEQS